MTKEVGDKGFAGLFASETLVRVLSWFLLHADRRYFQAELVRLTGSKLYLVQRALERLESAGLVERRQEGRRVYYWARRSHPAFEDLKRLFLKTFSLGDELRREFGRLGDEVRLAFIYGSFARGDEREGSDIDIFAVGDIGVRELSGVLTEMQQDLARELNSTVYDEGEFRQRAADGDPFLKALLAEPKIWLVGDDGELERLVGER